MTGEPAERPEDTPDAGGTMSELLSKIRAVSRRIVDRVREVHPGAQDEPPPQPPDRMS